VVAVLLVAVVVLNVRTFGGRSAGRHSSDDYQVQTHPPVPANLGLPASHTVSLQTVGREPAPTPDIDGLTRDPFFPHQAQPKTITRPQHSSSRAGTRTRSKPLTCSAIMLGGNRPMAIIDSEGRHPGDKIRGLTVTDIDADGVTLTRADGTTTRLTVGVQEDKDQAYRVVTRTGHADDHGRTRLVDQ